MNDNIFLLSTEEYEKYKDKIPTINCWWWLKSPGNLSNHIACVRTDGSISNLGNYVDGDDVAVRPALRFSAPSTTIGERKLFFDFPWVVIDKGLAIAEVPIGFHRFDVESNDYEKSEIRKFLFEWMDKRLVLSEGRIY